MKLTFERVEGCPVCGHSQSRSDFTRTFFGHVFHWVRCLRCAAVYQQPKLTRSSLATIYNSSHYWSLPTHQRARTGYGDYLGAAPARAAQARQRARLIADLVPAGSSLLDVGCAAGFFLREAAARGLRPMGVELCEVMARYGTRELGLDIRCGDLETVTLPPESYGAVTAWGLDSNFHDPRRAFSQMARLLAPGGVLAFNFFDYSHWSRPLLGEFKKAHNALYFLSRSHVVRVVEESGLRVERLVNEWHHTTPAEIFHQTGRPLMRKMVELLGLAGWVIRLPVPGGYLVVARKSGR